MSGKNEATPIEVHTHPFQQTSQPQQFNVGAASCAILLGMVFILLPITLAVDMVYDREVRVLVLNPKYRLYRSCYTCNFSFYFPAIDFLFN